MLLWLIYIIQCYWKCVYMENCFIQLTFGHGLQVSFKCKRHISYKYLIIYLLLRLQRMWISNRIDPQWQSCQSSSITIHSFDFLSWLKCTVNWNFAVVLLWQCTSSSFFFFAQPFTRRQYSGLELGMYVWNFNPHSNRSISKIAHTILPHNLFSMENELYTTDSVLTETEKENHQPCI